ncbi:MAG: mechanosensitive ion channel family protein [Cyanobacteria bacterium SID2]|nr:mechanosensitive ion channel family protein [Cyanobacteria bacterium SID2]
MIVRSIAVIVTELALIFAVALFVDRLFGQVWRRLLKFQWLKQRVRKPKQLRQRWRSSVTLFVSLTTLAVLGINGYWLYRGRDIWLQTIDLASRIPPEFAISSALGLFKSLLLLSIVGLALRPIRRGTRYICDRAKAYEQIAANDESIEKFFHFLDFHLANSLWLFALVGCTVFLPLPHSVPEILIVFARIYAIVVGGGLVLKASQAIIDSLNALSQKYANTDSLLRVYRRLQNLVPFLSRCLEAVIYIGVATLVVQQISAIAYLADFGTRIVKIIGIVSLGRMVVEVTHFLIEELLLRHPNLDSIQRQKRLTVIPLVQSGLRYGIYFGASIWILGVLEIDPTPILAAVGILGLAVGLGAQNLINDMVCGFFILFENYYLVGDFIETDDTMGVVESIELRTTRIRHPNGQVSIVRNGDIGKITNYSKIYVYAVVEVGVDYDCDLDVVYRVLKEVGQQFQQENENVLEATIVDGLNDFGASDLVIRTRTKVKPGTHLSTQRHLRKLIKQAFDRAGIEIPFPQRTLSFKDDIAPFEKLN